MRLFLLFLIFTKLLFATSYNGEIFTWGYGELIKNILDSIRMIVSNGGLATIFKAAFAIAFLLFAFKKAVDGKSSPVWEFGKMMLLAISVWQLFLNAPNDDKHRYLVTDKVTGSTYVVEQVPTGIGEPLKIITNLEDRIIEAMEKTFSLPDSISYRNSGLGFPLQDQIVLSDLSSPDIYFQLTFKEFIANCTLYEIQDGSKSVTQLMNANNLLIALDPSGDTRLTKVYSSANPDGEVQMCKDAYTYIKDYIQGTELDKQIKIASARLHATETTFLDRTNTLSGLFFETAQDARDYVQQNFLINITKKAFSSIAASTGLSASQLAYSTAVAQHNMNNKFITSGIIAKDYLPIIKGVLLTVIVALSWIMALLTIMFTDFRYIKMYITLLLWLFMWSPILVILNYIGDMYISKVFSSITSNTGQVLTMFNFNFVNNKVATTLAWLGYLVWLVPPLAYAIIKASEHGFVSLASSISQTASAGAGAGASAVGSLAQQTNPSMRVGNEVVTDMAGGAIQAHSLAYAYGHNYDIKSTHTQNGGETVSANMDYGGANASVTFGKYGNVTGASLTSSKYNATINSSVKAQAQRAVEEAKSQVATYSNKYAESISSGIKNSIDEKDSFNIDTTKATTYGEKVALSKAIVNSTEHSLQHNKQWQQYADAINKLAGQGNLSFSLKKIAGGGFNLEFSDGKGHRYSIGLSETEAKAFREQFSKSMGSELSTNEQARNAFTKVMSAGNSKYFAQSANEAKELNEAYQRLKNAKQVLSYLEEKGGNVGKNVLPMLLKDEIEEIKSKRPDISNEEVVELAMKNIDTYYQKGILMDVIKDRGYLDDIFKKGEDVKSQVDTQSKKVNEAIDTSKVKDRVKDKNEHTNDEVKENQNRINYVVNKNQSSPDDLKNKFNKSTQDYKTPTNIKTTTEEKSKLDSVDTKLNNSLLENFYNDHKAQIWAVAGAGALIVGAKLLGAKKAGDFTKAFKEKFDKNPQKAVNELQELEEVVNKNGNVKDYLKKHDPELLKQLEKDGVQFNKDGSLKLKEKPNIKPNEVEEYLKRQGYDKKTIEAVKSELSKPEVAKKVEERGFFGNLKQNIEHVFSKTKNFLSGAGKVGVGTLIEGTLFNPTSLGGGYNEQLSTFEGYKKDNDIVTSNEVSLVFNGVGGYSDELPHKIKSSIETDVNYQEWEQYVSQNSNHMQKVFNALKQHKDYLTNEQIEAIENASTPKELDNVLTQIAFPTKNDTITANLTHNASSNDNSLQINTSNDSIQVPSSKPQRDNYDNSNNQKDWMINIPQSFKGTEEKYATIHNKSFSNWENILGDQKRIDLYDNNVLNRRMKPDMFNTAEESRDARTLTEMMKIGLEKPKITSQDMKEAIYNAQTNEYPFRRNPSDFVP